MSDKKLVEKFMFHVPQSVMGTSFPPSVIKATQSEIETLRTQLAKANERVSELELENTNGNAASELLIWWAQKLSNAPNEDLKEVIRIGYKRIVNLANLIG